MIKLEFNVQPAIQRMETMRQNVREYASGEMPEAFLAWQIEDLERPEPSVERRTDSVETTMPRGRDRPRIRRRVFRGGKDALTIGRQRAMRRMQRRLRRKFIAPTRIRRLRRMIMPRRMMVMRRFRRLVGLPTVRGVRRKLGIRRGGYLTPQVGEILVRRMMRSMTNKMLWR